MLTFFGRRGERHFNVFLRAAFARTAPVCPLLPDLWSPTGRASRSGCHGSLCVCIRQDSRQEDNQCVFDDFQVASSQQAEKGMPRSHLRLYWDLIVVYCSTKIQHFRVNSPFLILDQQSYWLTKNQILQLMSLVKRRATHQNTVNPFVTTVPFIALRRDGEDLRS